MSAPEPQWPADHNWASEFGHYGADSAPEPARNPLPDGDVLAEYRDYATCGVCSGPMSLDEAEGNHGCESTAGPW